MLLVRIEHISGTRIKKFQEGLNRTRIMITIKIVFIYPTHSLIPLPLSPPIKIVLFVKKKKKSPFLERHEVDGKLQANKKRTTDLHQTESPHGGKGDG